MTGAARALPIAALVLAAGQSRRAGKTNKLLVPIHGLPMVARVLDHVLASGATPVIVVTGFEADRIEAALVGRDVTFAHNPDFADGMAGSIRAGIAALPDDVDGALVCLGDMPALGAPDIEKLIQAFDPAAGRAICVPVAGGRQGNPVLFARQFFPELSSLSGDRGAKMVIAAHEELVHKVEIAGEGTSLDLDTVEAITAFEKQTDQ